MTQTPFAPMTGTQSHFVSVNGNRLHYVTAGQGESTLVFVHGWGCHIGFWREQVAALSSRARLILLDLPGHGRSDPPQTPSTMDAFAEAVRAVLRDAGVSKAVFIGHSMGGAVICRVYHHAPESVLALVSVDGLLCRLPGTAAEGRALAGPFAAPHYREHATGFIRSLFPFPGAETLCEQVTAEMLKTPQSILLAGMLALLDPTQPDWRLQHVNGPVLVINARSSWWTGDYENYVRSLSSHADYRTMEGASHFLMLEQPAAFNALLSAMLVKSGLI